jgi:hypothetical protein
VLVSASVLAFGAWAVGLRVPREPYYVQWEPRRPKYSPFLGRLSTLSLNGLKLSAGDIVVPSRLAAPHFAGHITLEGHITPGAEPDAIALIARIAIASGELFMIGQQHDALIARYGANAHRAGLRSPIFALGGVLRAKPAAPVHVRVATRLGEIELRAMVGSRVHIARYRMSTARLWATMLPFEYGFGPSAILGDLLWLGLLFGPAAYGGARSNRGWRGIAPASALTALLALIAFVAQPALWWWPFWMAVALAGAAGHSLGVRAAERDGCVATRH